MSGEALRLEAMVEYLKQLTPILQILLGWLLGLFTQSIAERIRRPYRRRDLTRAVVDEMLGLQHTMALVAFLVRKRYSNVSDAFLDEILPIVEGYRGPDRDEKLAEALRKSRSLPQEERAAVHDALRKPNVAMGMRQYAIPLFAAHLADLAICTLDFQRSVLKVRYHLDLYNQCVYYTQSLFEKTFNKPSPEDREALVTNQEQGYRDAGLRAEIIMQEIGDLQKRYGSAK
jgi:hypothetical protein